ncbi:MAG: tRNA uridine-5-carboxymethylaminomethyl(34) synthesis GTPase MnmE [Gemmatimonadota bacterium]|nr:tRNA uridine-5-carboxymethylaminomethyl(34) synthesis GTPase MnmE [Gemmatimonadota bacterium]
MSDPLSEDTIAAIATAPGRAAVALVRVSGPGALRMLEAVAPSARKGVAARTIRLCKLRHPETGDELDQALVTYFPGPGSYTGEDVVEISTHGGLLTPQLVLAALVAAGARAAEPGEFTRRAVLNGKLDLLQAEAIAELIDGHAPALHRAALHQMEGGLSRRIGELREALLMLEALLAYSIDFPEEDEPPVPPMHIRAAGEDVCASMDALLATAPEGELLREGALVVLAGRPNSGKSSLFNALLGVERAIVTEVPGTTRDALEAELTLDGFPFRLVDTAGLRATGERVEQMGIEVAHRYLRSAQIVLYCAEAGRPMDEGELDFLAAERASKVVLARTKVDLPDPPLRVPGTAPSPGGKDDLAGIRISTSTGVGLAELKMALLATGYDGILGRVGEAPVITRQRQVRALVGARTEISAFLQAWGSGIPAEFAATHLRAAADALEEMVGVIGQEEVLDRVFASFCIGK